MLNTFKLIAATLALTSTPVIVAAQSTAVSLSATFDTGGETNAAIGLDGSESASLNGVSALSISQASGKNAAASTASVNAQGMEGVTFSNSAGGDLLSSEQAGSFGGGEYSSTINFGNSQAPLR